MGEYGLDSLDINEVQMSDFEDHTENFLNVIVYNKLRLQATTQLVPYTNTKSDRNINY